MYTNRIATVARGLVDAGGSSRWAARRTRGTMFLLALGLAATASGTALLFTAPDSATERAFAKVEGEAVHERHIGLHPAPRSANRDRSEHAYCNASLVV